MKTTRRTEIMMETHETTVIRFRHSQTIIFCESCQANTQHLSIFQAVSILSLSESKIAQFADDKQIHLTQTADGLLMLCGNSLAALEKK